MALVVADRIKETTTTTGTGTYTLGGASTGFEAFSVIGNGNTTYYCCTDGTDFEVGIGTYTASGTTLARTTILQSSNSDSAVNWGSGTRDIFVTQPAEKAVFRDASGHIIALDGRNLTSLNASEISSGTLPEDRLPDGGAGAATYGSTANGTKIDTITLDAKGRVTAVATGSTGDIEGVTAGTGLSGGGSSGTVTLNLDFSELTDMTGDVSGTTEFILQNGTTESRKAASEIGLSAFDNDAGFTTNTGDITGVTAGTGLSGGGDSGSVTLNVSGLTVSELAANSLTTSAESFADNDTTLMTSAAINDRIESFGYTTNTGDITGVTAGTGLSGGGSSGSVTLNVSGLTVSELAADSLTTSSESFADNNTTLMTSAAINDRIESFGYSTTTGTVTSVGTTGTVNGITLTGTVTSSGNLTLGGTLGSITVSQLAGSALTTSAESFADNDTTLMTSAAINDRIESFGYTTNTGDITGVTAGTGLSGGGSSGGVTLNVSGLTVSELAADSLTTSSESFADNDTTLMTSAAINDRIESFGYSTTTGTVTSVGTTGTVNGITLTGTVTSSGNLTLGGTLGSITVSQLAGSAVTTSSESFADNDTTLMTSAAINDRIESFGYTTNTGDITGVTAGTGLSGGGSSGSVTLNVSGLTVSELAADSLTTSSESFADNDTTLMTSAAINDRITSFGYTTNTGDITGVTAGTGLSGGGSSGAVTLAVDLSELTDMTQTMVGTDEFIVLDNGADRRKAANEIPLSIFNDDRTQIDYGLITGAVTATNDYGAIT
mgnify:CR=1 FL=1|tara:strand:+ start:15805 stop:18141 length:2337 start_codon:yes stop_codon:yes gene_type:complete